MKQTENLQLPVLQSGDKYTKETQNEAFKKIDLHLGGLAKRVNNIVASGGESNIEIVDARRDNITGVVHNTIGERINSVSEQLDTKANKADVDEISNNKADKTALENTNSNLATQANRIDNLIIYSGQGTEKDAEVIDGRTGIDGTTFSLIGDNIRTSSNNVYSFINNVFNFKNEMIMNLLNKNNMADGKAIDANGNEVVQSGCSFTNEYLFLKKGESITLNFATYFTIAKYNTSKVFITNIRVNDEDLPYVFTADSDMYVRFNVYKDNKDSAMVVKGKVLPSKYISYGEKIPYPSELTFNDFQKVYNVINENYTTNLFNKDNVTDGKIIDANGGEIEYTAGCYTNDYLLLRKGERITLNFATYFTIAVYNLNKVFKTNKVVNNEDLPYTFTADEDVYLRFNVYNEQKDNAMVVYGNTLPIEYITHGSCVPSTTFNKSELKGSYLFVGDSICYGAGATGGYAKLIANKNPNMTYKNIGVSGATICRRNQGDGGTSILNKVEEEIALNAKYDHIILEGGLNDLWNQNTWPLGSYDEYDRASSLNEMTICGAFESLIRKCKDKWNNTFIYYLIPHSIDRKNTKVGFDTLKSIAKKYNVIVIDLRELSGMDEAVDNIKNSYTSNSDGVHPNEDGYARFYVNPIISILNNYQH